MKEIQVVNVPDVPQPSGHYSHAVAHAGVVYVSGQLGRTPAMSDEEAGDIEAQTRRALSSLAAILRASGSDMTRLLKVNIYVSDISLWPSVNRVYEQALGAHRPARAVIPTRPLHFNALLEIDAIAATGGASPS